MIQCIISYGNCAVIQQILIIDFYDCRNFHYIDKYCYKIPLYTQNDYADEYLCKKITFDINFLMYIICRSNKKNIQILINRGIDHLNWHTFHGSAQYAFEILKGITSQIINLSRSFIHDIIYRSGLKSNKLLLNKTLLHNLDIRTFEALPNFYHFKLYNMLETENLTVTVTTPQDYNYSALYADKKKFRTILCTFFH